MSFPRELHLNFSCKGLNYNLDLAMDKKSDYSVEINGVRYAVLGESEKLNAACDILSSISLDALSTPEDLKERLFLRGDISFPQTTKTSAIATKALKQGLKPITMETAYQELTQKLESYAKKQIGKGALLVQVVGIEGAEKPQLFGQLSVDDPTPVDENTIGRTGSGAKLWAGLLSTILTKKYPQQIKMDDTLEKFAPEEALRKFGILGPDGEDIPAPELAKEMSLEAMVGMTAGLEYEDRSPKDSSRATLDELMRSNGPIQEGAIHLVYDPRDHISVYSNNISLTAYPIEKAYKKVIAAQLIDRKELDENQTLRELSEKVEPLRAQLTEQIATAERHLERLTYQRDHVKSGSTGRAKKGNLNTQIDAHKKRLDSLKEKLKKLPPPIPDSALDLTLQELLECDAAYISKPPHEKVYIYDLIDRFLMQFDPEKLTTSNHHRVSYADIMKRELLDPMGMTHSGFYGTKGTEMDVTFTNSKSKRQQSKAPPHENVMLHAAGGGRTTLTDASKLAQGLADKRGLVDKEGELLLSQEDLHYLFSPHGHYTGWGLGGSELSCEGAFVEKGGSFDQDTYTFWVDRTSGVGLIAMCNCNKRPVHILEAFKEQVKNISHPGMQDLPREKEATAIHLALQDYIAHPLEDPKEYYEGTRGKIALLFDPDTDDAGVMHWSGTPLQLVKQESSASEGRKFRITTPGRFENVEVWKVRGAHQTEQEYLAVGDTSFIKTTVDRIPSDADIAYAKKEFHNFVGDYINSKHREWGIFRFDVKGKGDDIFLCACAVEEGSQMKASVPLGIIKVEKNAISFNGHDRQPPDKIFRFVRASESAPWRLQVTDVASPGIVIEERRASPSEVGAWSAKEAFELPEKQRRVAQAYWTTHLSEGSKKDHSMLINFLKSLPNSPPNLEALFAQSIETRDFELFQSLFKHLSMNHLLPIDRGEQLHTLALSFSDQPVTVTTGFLQDVRDFMRDSSFSGVVAISDGSAIHTVASKHIKEPQAVFAMHSVGKVFTGTLMLRLIEEGVIPRETLEQPIQLSEEVVKHLPPAVREQLAKTTMHDVMLHRGRYGDYLEKYQNAIEKGVKEGVPPPQIHRPQDFLAYADEQLIPLEKLEPDGSSYSNLGLLLVGLSIEHLYNQHTGESLSYSEILNRYVLEPAGVETFQTEMPQGARVNKEDPSAAYIAGGPAGGYWSTAEDLVKFGAWLGEKSKEEPFMKLVESFGGEFYRDREFSHGGSIESASAHLSHRIDNGLTIAVMSDMTGLGRASEVAATIQQHLITDS